MDASGGRIARADEFLWHLSNFGIGVAVLVATFLYAPPGSRSIDFIAFSIDPFYLLVPLSVAYIGWTGTDLWRRYSAADS